MGNKLRAGVLGATGAAGQEFLEVLQDHPNFKVERLYASSKSAGKKLSECDVIVKLNKDILALVIQDGEKINTEGIDILFSAVEMAEKEKIKEIEGKYARFIPVISVNSAWRYDELVPVIIPEVNASHAEIIKLQRKAYGWKGFVSPGPNCTTVGAVVFTKCILTGFPKVKKIRIVSMQSASGAGRKAVLARREQVIQEAELIQKEKGMYSPENYRDVLIKNPPAKQFQANIITQIDGEEEKVRKEVAKLLGDYKENKIVPLNVTVNARCYRTSQERGHLVDMELTLDEKCTLLDVKNRIENFNKSMYDKFGELPSSPRHAIKVDEDEYGPQPLLRVGLEGGMVTYIGKLEVQEENSLTVIKAAILSDNLGKGASRGAVHTAEYLLKERYLF
ncbi:hypothetical protein HY745_11515 [Candidatus Desantisbacteria bacterium]|nr:hypothetical protein [Candidatus Desantisbacteria bacterium]